MCVDHRPWGNIKHGRKATCVIIVAMAQYDGIGLSDIGTKDSCVFYKQTGLPRVKKNSLVTVFDPKR
jgi:hypothetical protein